MMKNLLLIAGAFLLVVQQASAQNFSVDEGQFTNVGTPAKEDNIYGPSVLPQPAPPSLVLPGGTGTGEFWDASNVDAFSYNYLKPFQTITAWAFSVGLNSQGIPGSAVATQAGLGQFGQAATDVFSSSGSGTNTLLHDGDGSTPSKSALGLDELSPQSGGVDGYDASPAGPPPPGGFIYWSGEVDGFGGSEIFISSGVPGFATTPVLFADEGQLGLGSGVGGYNNIDALLVLDHGIVGSFDFKDIIFFSLSSDSDLVRNHTYEAGDILVSNIDAHLQVYVPAAALGLGPIDDLNALSAVPLPAAFWLFGSALLGLGALKRRKA